MPKNIFRSFRGGLPQKTEGSIRFKNDASGAIFNRSDLTKGAVRFSDPSDGSDSEELEFDPSGKLVVKAEFGKAMMGASVSFEDHRTRSEGYKRRRSNVHQCAVAKMRKKSDSSAVAHSHKSKLARGDSKKKGQKFEPYTYMPLDGKCYSKKNRRNTVKQMDGVISNTRFKS